MQTKPPLQTKSPLAFFFLVFALSIPLSLAGGVTGAGAVTGSSGEFARGDLLPNDRGTVTRL